MITGKQRAFLRSISNNLSTAIQIGKDEIDDKVIENINNNFVRKELLKINFLKSSSFEPKKTAEFLSTVLNCEIVSIIGRKIVIYRYNKDLADKGESIILPH